MKDFLFIAKITPTSSVTTAADIAKSYGKRQTSIQMMIHITAPSKVEAIESFKTQYPNSYIIRIKEK